MAFTKVLDTGLDAGHVGIRTAGSIIGVGFSMLNFIGAGNTFLDRGNGLVDISIAGSGGAGDAVVRENFVVTANEQSSFTLNGESHQAEILRRAGKATGIYRNTYNIKYIQP